ncbi:MAG: thymidine phosphorylase [Malacoplasma sp.]
MNIVNLIEKKKTNKKITEAEFDFFIKGILDKSIKDYQTSAFLMSIFFSKLDFNETYFLTKAIVENGLIINFASVNEKIIDKHSTGGIGDKVSLILVPILASLGIKVAKMSGRGLGYTGGTIDKLESVGVETEISETKCLKLLNEFNMFIIAQNKDIAPADKILYAIRDTSGSINNISLIASSIMSKKLATNTDKIYLDVKVGDGAFFPNLKEAKEFSELCIKIGKKFKKSVVVHLTNMSKPLGKCLGNMIEIKESISFLKGDFYSSQLKKLIFDFSIDILIDMKKAKDEKDACKKIENTISSLKAYNLFCKWAKAQNSNFDFDNIDNEYNPKNSIKIYATKNGYIDFYSNKVFGYSLIDIKAGRMNKDEKLDFLSGIYLNKSYNDKVKKDDLIMTVFSNSEIPKDTISKLEKNIIYSEKKGKEEKIILGLIK